MKLQSQLYYSLVRITNSYTGWRDQLDVTIFNTIFVPYLSGRNFFDLYKFRLKEFPPNSRNTFKNIKHDTWESKFKFPCLLRLLQLNTTYLFNRWII